MSKKMKQLFFIFIFFCARLLVHGLIHPTDTIIYQGDTLYLMGYPLNKYPDKSLINPQKLFGSSEGVYGYAATWEITDNKLYLRQIRNYSYGIELQTTTYKGKEKIVGNEYADLKLLFPDKYENGKVLADWITGEMYAPFGAVLMWIGNDECSHEFEYKFSVENGKLEKVETLDNRKTRHTVFSSPPDKSRDTVLKYIQSNIDWNRLPVLPKDSVVRVRLSFSANENGVIDDVHLLKPKVSDSFTEEAIRIIKTIPWGVRFFHGKLSRLWYTLPVTFIRPLDEEDTRLLNERDSLIAHYSEEQKVQIVKKRENISDSIKVLFYKEFQEKGLRKYNFSYLFIDYTPDNKYVKASLEKDKNIVPFILNYYQESAERIKQLSSSDEENTPVYYAHYDEYISKSISSNKHEMINKSISSCWHPLTYYNGSFYNCSKPAYKGFIITDSAFYTYFVDRSFIRKFTIAEDKHLIFTYNRGDEEQTLDVYFVDESHQFAVFKFSGRRYPQLYVNCSLMTQIPMIIGVGNTIDAIAGTRDDLPEEVDLFCKAVTGILKSQPLVKNP
jgi:hypothetical protein